MPRFLPPQPDFQHLKNEAKALHKAHRNRNREVCPVLRHLRRFRDADDETILNTHVVLTEVQFALAQTYGFKSWPELRSVILSLKPQNNYMAQGKDDAMLLPEPAAGVNGLDQYVAAFSMALSYLEAPADYETIAGDTGLAFIFQSDTLIHPHGAKVQNLDIGWWPLDAWGINLRLDFLGTVTGVPVRRLPWVVPEYEADAAAHYQDHHKAPLETCLHAGYPAVMTYCVDVGVVFGLDTGEPPLLIQKPSIPERQLKRAEHYPWNVYVFDKPGETLDRLEADRQALEYAVRLGFDRIDLSHLPGKSAGRRSWKLWASQLADEALCGPHFFHANVIRYLKEHRTTAAGYLRSMSRRHTGSVIELLNQAAESYDVLVDKLDQADVSEQQLSTAKGRSSFIKLIDELVVLENQALLNLSDVVHLIS